MKKDALRSLILGGSIQLAMLANNVRAACDSNSIQGGADCAQGSGSSGDLLTNIHKVTDTITFVIGIAAVIMILIGALRYAVSGGDEKGTRGAKDTIIFAVVGLVIAIVAYAIVNFVISRFQ